MLPRQVYKVKSVFILNYINALGYGKQIRQHYKILYWKNASVIIAGFRNDCTINNHNYMPTLFNGHC